MLQQDSVTEERDGVSRTRKVVGHGVVLRVVLQLFRNRGVTEEESEGREDILARRRKGLGRGEVRGHRIRIGHGWSGVGGWWLSGVRERTVVRLAVAPGDGVDEVVYSVGWPD